MPHTRIAIFTVLALIAFAGNSLLCRAALAHTRIDAASFTTVRLLSGALVLWCLVWLRKGARTGSGYWLSALALFAYAAGFSFSYVHLTAAAGALLLFGAGIAWGIYSLRGKGGGDPLKVTAGNFVRAAPMAVVMSVLLLDRASLEPAGIGYALLSGALASGVGYAIWYTALPFLKSTTAATVQLSVPIIAASGGVFILGEPFTLRLLAASVAIIGGIALVVLTGKRKEKHPTTR